MPDTAENPVSSRPDKFSEPIANGGNPGIARTASIFGWNEPARINPRTNAMYFSDVLRSRRLRGWLLGATVACLTFLVGNANRIATLSAPIQMLLWLHIIAFLAVFLAVPPLSWASSVWARYCWTALLAVLSLLFVFDGGDGWTWMWIFVTVAVGVQSLPRRVGVFIIFGLGGLALALQLLRGVSLSDASVQVIAIVSVGLMMATVDRLRRTIAALRATQHELADVAVSEERNRVARDIHDILGHSLTVITVKAELAGRLIDAEPERAKQEIAEVEDLSRGALADVRATVSGYRGVTITGELANAHQALEAAGIEAVLPGATESVRSKDRELFGWVAREGVTNVIRHSGATRCRISVAADHIYIDDDGVGPGSGNTEGNGLSGLAERAVASGGSIVFGASPLGGTRLGVKL